MKISDLTAWLLVLAAAAVVVVVAVNVGDAATEALESSSVLGALRK